MTPFQEEIMTRYIDYNHKARQNEANLLAKGLRPKVTRILTTPYTIHTTTHYGEKDSVTFVTPNLQKAVYASLD